jgi:hypothetical protein
VAKKQMKAFRSIAFIFCGLFLMDESAISQTNLISVGHINDFQYGAMDVAVAGHYVFLANGGDGLRIYDVSNPENPIGVGHTNNVGRAGNAMGIALFGDYAYVANSNDGMRIYDISVPTHPVDVGHSPEVGQPASSFGIAVSGVQPSSSFEPFRSWLFGKRKYGAQCASLYVRA